MVGGPPLNLWNRAPARAPLPPARRGAARELWNRDAAGAAPARDSVRPAPPRLIAPRQATHAAAGALWAFALFQGVALVAWFRTAPLPWTVGSVIAITTGAAAVMMSIVVWRAPTRGAVIAGGLVMLASLLRLGLPSSWTVMSAVVFDVTIMVAIPVVRAILAFAEQ
jgi:hypothetical protein